MIYKKHFNDLKNYVQKLKKNTKKFGICASYLCLWILKVIPSSWNWTWNLIISVQGALTIRSQSWHGRSRTSTNSKIFTNFKNRLLFHFFSFFYFFPKFIMSVTSFWVCGSRTPYWNILVNYLLFTELKFCQI